MAMPLRLLLLAVIVAALVQLAKLFIPLINGFMALALNLFVSTVAVVFGRAFTNLYGFATATLLVALAAAGIHGTATKLADFPNPRENPTPSGTPAQNYDKIDAGP